MSAHRAERRLKSLRVEATFPFSRTRFTTRCMWSLPASERPWRTATQRHGGWPLPASKPRRRIASRATSAHSSSLKSRSTSPLVDSARCQQVPPATSVPYSTLGASMAASRPFSSATEGRNPPLTPRATAAATTWGSSCSLCRPAENK